MQVAFFYVKRKHPFGLDYDPVAMAEMMIASVQVAMGDDVEITHLTDIATPVIPGVNRFVGEVGNILKDRLKIQAEFLEQAGGTVIFMEPDMLMQRPLPIGEPMQKDIYLCYRDQDIPVRKEMPVSDGLLIAGQGAVNLMHLFYFESMKLPNEYDSWFADIKAIINTIGLDTFNNRSVDELYSNETSIGLLYSNPYHYVPETDEPYRGAYVVHFGGQRKKFMKSYYDNYNEGE